MKCPHCHAPIFKSLMAATFVTRGLELHKTIACPHCQSRIELELPTIARADRSTFWGFSMATLLGNGILYYTDWPMPTKLTAILLGASFALVVFWVVIAVLTKIGR